MPTFIRTSVRPRPVVITVTAVVAIAMMSLAASGATRLLRHPTISRTRVAFMYAGDIWVAARDGSDPVRLTVHRGVETNPVFSPDGQWLAFSGSYDGNTDVYVLPVTGGAPYRVTYHPGADIVQGWTPDGARILFSSQRGSFSRFSQLFVVDAAGGLPEALPMPMAEQGAFSPDGRRLAYTPIRDATGAWKHYRGGMMGPITIVDLGTYEEKAVPHMRATDAYPMWVDETIYFLSDRNGTRNIFAYDLSSATLHQVTRHNDFDVKSAGAGPDAVIYEQAGYLHRLDLKTEQSVPLEINIVADLPGLRPHYENVKDEIRSMALSPTGTRAVFGARGDIFTVPAKKGETRNLTRTPGVHERFPSWSPDGRWIAYLSDVGGEYVLMMREQSGLEEPKVMSLGDPVFYYRPSWSPDGKKLVYTDKRLNLFMIDVVDKKPILIDTDTYDHPERTLNPVWSPCSKWVAYTKRLETQFHAVFLYDVETGEKHQVTDGMSDCSSACFSRDGKYLFMTASTDFGLGAGWLDLSSMGRRVHRSIYLSVLDRKEPSPFRPESDEEAVADTAEAEGSAGRGAEQELEDVDEAAGSAGSAGSEEEPTARTTIDFPDIDQRIVALPIPAADYASLQAAGGGKLFYIERKGGGASGDLHRFDMEKRKSELFMSGILGYAISADGKKLLWAAPGSTFGIVETGGTAKVGDGVLSTEHMDMLIDPRVEWAQIFAEAWRIERDFFYDATMHGTDWNAVGMRYRSWVPYVGHRADLNYVLAEMIGELVVGHAYVGGGDMPDVESVNVGLLGAEFEVRDGAYRVARIMSGENWNPELRAPLTEPGVDVHEGDYLLAVNGAVLEPPTNPYALFQNTVGRQTVLTVNSEAMLEGARKVTVVPIGSERALRFRAWVEGNRRRVDELSGGRVAYVYMPDTSGSGMASFNRYFFAQIDRDAAVIDERFNGGGYVADIIIDLLDRPLLSWWATREGKSFSSPFASIYGPKVMLINEYAGSGGDAMPHFFRRAGIGKLIGKRTWGGLVGIYDYPTLIDGGYITAPRVAIYGPDGRWEVENQGVPPDIEVGISTRDHAAGRDPQLERAVDVVLRELEAKPLKRARRPAPDSRAVHR